jgi:non-ribosomal peptide synthetase component F
VCTTAVSAPDSRAYWRDVLVRGGGTTVPRWTDDPVPGVAGYEAPVPDVLTEAATRLGRELVAPLHTVLLAVHARVLRALSGEREVVTGYVVGGRALPLLLPTDAASWRDLARTAHRDEARLLAHSAFPLEELRRETGLRGPAFETVFDPAGGAGDLPAGSVLGIGVVQRDGRYLLWMRYRTDALDAGCAARIADYHLTALALIAADPDALHRWQTLPPAGQPPERRVHGLFEQPVTTHAA